MPLCALWRPLKPCLVLLSITDINGGVAGWFSLVRAGISSKQSCQASHESVLLYVPLYCRHAIMSMMPTAVSLPAHCTGVLPCTLQQCPMHCLLSDGSLVLPPYFAALSAIVCAR